MANQGGTHEQHVKAGQASHKGSDTKTGSSSSKAGKSASSKSSSKSK